MVQETLLFITPDVSLHCTRRLSNIIALYIPKIRFNTGAAEKRAIVIP